MSQNAKKESRKTLQNVGIIGENSSLVDVFKILSKVAPTDSTVLVTGESGTGKEVLVRALHNASPRQNNSFIPVNCGAIPKELLESELFGHEKGAFTHAIRTKPGRFELAEGGTIFLDEIGEMDTSLQVKILRVLQEKEIERVGGSGPRKIDVRIVAATNRDLEHEVAIGNFREDLFYRLNVIPLHLPPLRERGDDIITLTTHFLKYFCEKKNRDSLLISEDVARVFLNYTWPGNVRELENFMERLSILADGPSILIEDLPLKILNNIGGVENIENLPALSDSSKQNLSQSGVLSPSLAIQPIEEITPTEKAKTPLLQEDNDFENVNFEIQNTSIDARLSREEKQSLASIFSTSNIREDLELDEDNNQSQRQAKEDISPPNTSTSTHSDAVQYGHYDAFGFAILPSLEDMKKRGIGLKEFLELIEDKIMNEALEQVEGVKNQAAELLGIKRTTLIEKLKKRKDDA